MRRLLILAALLFFVTTALAQTVPPSGVNTGPIDQLWQARFLTIAGQVNAVGWVAIVGGLPAYPVRLHLIQAYCAQSSPLLVIDGAGAQVFADTIQAGVNYLQVWGYPGLLNATNSLKVSAGPCGVGNKLFLHVAYSP